VKQRIEEDKKRKTLPTPKGLTKKKRLSGKKNNGGESYKLLKRIMDLKGKRRRVKPLVPW